MAVAAMGHEATRARDISHATAMLAFAAATLALATDAAAICCPFPPIGNTLQSSGQANLVVMDRDAGRVTLIANVGLSGTGEVFSLVLPTPSEPSLETVPAEIWEEVAEATGPGASVRRPADTGPFGCGAHDVTVPAGHFGTDDGVIVHGEQSVGAFDATLLTATSATALVDWLGANGFAYAPEDSAAFSSYITHGWYFTAMILDSTAVDLPEAGWSVTLDPVAVSFDAATFEVPLPILNVNRSTRFEVTFLVIDDVRATLPGFRTRYANHVSPGELAAFRDETPVLAGYLDSGRVLVRLERVFVHGNDMSQPIHLTRHESDDEVYPFVARRSGVDSGPVLLGLIALGAAVRASGRLRARRDSSRGTRRAG